MILMKPGFVIPPRLERLKVMECKWHTQSLGHATIVVWEALCVFDVYQVVALFSYKGQQLVNT